MDGFELHLQPWQREASQDIRAITELLVLRVNNSLKQGLRSRTMNPLSIGDFGAQQGSGEAEGVDTEAANSPPAAANHGHPLPCDQQVVSPSRTFIGAGVPQTEVFSQGEIQRLKHFTRQG